VQPYANATKLNTLGSQGSGAQWAISGTKSF